MNLHPRFPIPQFDSGCTALRYALLLLGLLFAGSIRAQDDPPSSVARLADLSGDVSFAPAGDDNWDQVSINRPLITGDRLLTGPNSRAAMDIGSGALRIGGNTGFNFLSLDDHGTQIELTRGTLNWRVDTLADGQNFEVDTPTVAFVVGQPGEYRIDVAEDGSATTISVEDGAGTVYGENGVSYPVSGRQAWRFGDTQLSDVTGMPLAEADNFDLWCNDRDQVARRDDSTRYVSPDMVGFSDLGNNGNWDNVADYGTVWYPSTVAVGWAPYRYGHWAWIAPWGWTWIDDASWGFAPFHYGRWVYVGNRWGWVPGPPQLRPVYTPAMVAFVGGNGWSASMSSGQPIGWVPLGPRDVFVPWYAGSRRYFTNVNVTNVTNINRSNITNVYNNVQVNRVSNVTYMNQSVPGAVTVVSRDTFSNGRPVNRAQVAVNNTQLSRAPMMMQHDLPAGRPGLGLQSAATRQAPSDEFTRPPISYRTPPPASLALRGPRASTNGTGGAMFHPEPREGFSPRNPPSTAAPSVVDGWHQREMPSSHFVPGHEQGVPSRPQNPPGDEQREQPQRGPSERTEPAQHNVQNQGQARPAPRQSPRPAPQPREERPHAERHGE